jgi:hypothetical protein
MPRQASGRHLLTGLIRCARCGGRMSGNRRTTGEQRYRCDGWRNGAGAPRRDCQQTVPSRRIDGPVLAEVAALVEDLATSTLDADLRRTWDNVSRSPEHGTAARDATLKREAATARKRLTDAARLLVDGALDRAGYEALRDAERARLDAAEAEIARLAVAGPAPSLPPLDTVVRQAGSWARILQAADAAAQREVLGILIEVVVPVRVRWATYRPAITWTPVGAALRRTRGDSAAVAA